MPFNLPHIQTNNDDHDCYLKRLSTDTINCCCDNLSKLSNSLKENTTVKNLFIYGNGSVDYSTEDIDALADLLKYTNTITNFIFAVDSNDDYQKILEAISCNKSITQFRLNARMFANSTFEHLVDMLNNNKVIKSFAIESYNNIDNIIEYLSSNTTIANLTLSCSYFDPLKFKLNPLLEKLKFKSCCVITDDMIKVVVDKLQSYGSLTSLSITESSISSTAADVSASLFSVNRSIKIFNCRNLHIIDQMSEGCMPTHTNEVTLPNILKRNQTITTLKGVNIQPYDNIKYCNVITELASVLRNDKILKHIELRCDDSMMTNLVFESLQDNNCLVFLTLWVINGINEHICN